MSQSSQPGRNIIFLPQQAVPHQAGPFCAIHSGLVTGVYPQKSWVSAGVGNFIKPKNIKQFVDPMWQNFPTWNQAVWYCERGTTFGTTALELQPYPLPTRKVQPVEVLSAFYPPGSTIVIEDDDHVLPYHGEGILPTVSILRRRDLEAEEGMGEPLSLHPPSQTRPLPPSTLVVPGDVSTQAHLGQQLSPPPPTLLDPNSRPSTPVGGNSGPGKRTRVVRPRVEAASQPSKLANMWLEGAPSKRQANDPFAFPPSFPGASQSSGGSSSQPSSSQASQVSSTTDQNEPVDPMVVVHEACQRLRLLRTLRFPNQAVEDQVNACLIVLLLETTTLTPEGAQKIRDAAAML